MTRRLPLAAALVAVAAILGCGDEEAGSRPDLTAVTEGVTGAGSDLTTITEEMVRAGPASVLPVRVAGRGTLTAHVTRAKVLRSRPGGRRLARLPRRTEFGSPRVVTVVRRRGDWLAVLAPQLRNGRIGWIDGRTGVRLSRTAWSMTASLSRRELTVRRDGRVVRRVRVAIGRPSSPTPRGLYAVTDKLLTGRPDGPYGCCALALTGHQPNTPQGWGGGDRLALHATPAEHTIGEAASLGCLRATNAAMRRLVREIPLGTRLRVTR